MPKTVKKIRKVRTDRVVIAVSLAMILIFASLAAIQFIKGNGFPPSELGTSEGNPQSEQLVAIKPDPVDLCGTNAVMETIMNFVADPIAQGSEFSISYHSLSDDCTYEYEADQQWLAASTAKVAIALLSFETIQRGEWSLETWIDYNGDVHFESGAGPLQYEPEFTGATVGELVELMITQSDNIATNMLLSQLGWTIGTQEYISTITGIASRDVTQNRITAQQHRLLLEHLLDPATPGHQAILEWMYEASDQTRLAAITRYDGTTPAIAHKIGDYADESGIYIHDIAIIDAPKPYLLVVMTSTVLERAYVYEQITELGNRILALHELG